MKRLSIFFFNDTATTEIYTLSLHDALPIFRPISPKFVSAALDSESHSVTIEKAKMRSEEHTSELQSPCNLVCRLLLEKKNSNSTLPLWRIRESPPSRRCSDMVSHLISTHV